MPPPERNPPCHTSSPVANVCRQASLSAFVARVAQGSSVRYRGAQEQHCEQREADENEHQTRVDHAIDDNLDHRSIPRQRRETALERVGDDRRVVPRAAVAIGLAGDVSNLDDGPRGIRPNDVSWFLRLRAKGEQEHCA